MTKRTTSPFSYDIVGSFLRPDKLKAARTAFEADEITQAELTKVEDEAIIDLINKQEAAGLKAVTDGEFRRSWWHLDFFWGLQGVEFTIPEHGYFFHGEETRPGTVIVTGKISGDHHPFVEHFKFTRAHTSEGIEVKQTIPAPAQILVELLRPDVVEKVREIYPTNERLIEDIVKAYRQVIADLYAAGARTIQLDDCTWGVLVAPLPEGFIAEEGKDEKEVRKELAQLYLSINNAVLADQPADLILNTHVCRGNYHSTWAAAGGYDDVADPLFTAENVHAYYLEYDTERSGGFEPLAKVSGDKKVVLGLITSKDGTLEDRQQVIARIREAAQYVPLDRLSLSPQCGFASTEEGNILTEEQQWNKIALIKSIAEEVWPEK
ncbi:5-methyltetrahydropteroyltriglutamate--homocysteine S-methyltransferase [Enterococcus dongliensis]|uniref:5-methyltetrahydropteroyltriglutamate--homocysteine S-methyltransferase n=1 Tax=Enterococcus dongliensis TaxID=2559925 RepID=A0AAP5NLU0_9ENTE|nr:5-methyltetrahydropteroyltriglutamate--homocysteine S-methyltransferase [Enterococcus dongliensis]MDT2596698.1 5-methyltetrahydropteroyltriglutamate--homocysteine S-methyltransferase [Enterococcus dongliensis]MDT2604225.1 5-methyltetrahydropteroyltriglutamate--homocysteine S-methyltransferase [Enterococcus dongliensis]MDT2634583.1 5-methyltetrahydropteroyltriglutamate--homocysteine S-methyltransferase [Enterococcus dongliensis]MDT2637593.1 5-methyltetrahydropteroyltriglutamate--homocysteine 